MKLLIVILNYRTAKLTIDCLQSIAAQTADRTDTSVVVLENGSGDNSAAELGDTIAARGWSSRVELILSGTNLGFTAGNNLAIRRALDSPDPPDYFLLLNSDTVMLPGAIDALVQFMDDHPDVGIAGSRLEYPSGEVQGSPFRFHTVASEFDRGVAFGPVSRMLARWTRYDPKPTSAAPAEWVAGASMVLRRETIRVAGLFDEAFFAYFEDMDYCRAAARKGWSTWYVPASRVVHIEGASSGIRSGPYASPPAYYFEGRRRFFRKNYGEIYASAADAALIAGCAAGLLYAMIRRREVRTAVLKLRDAWRHSVFAVGLREV
ncbi:MAG TPA: glycosyltransferase family 2 protein [Bryobacteraceae bacterium]|nr:glycosyltransferase family 2 protein [Bryobacteraceae bacterium]